MSTKKLYKLRVACGGPKKSPRTSSITLIVFSLKSFEISEDVLRNQKIIIGLDSFSNSVQYMWLCLDNNSLRNDCPVESCKITVFLFGLMLLNLKSL